MPTALKDPAVRQRRNRVTSAATLNAESVTVRVPKLPKLQPDPETGITPEWDPLTKSWWRDVWRSPMAAEYLQSDIHGLYLLAALVDRFWKAPDVKLAAEIRQQRQCFGITPLDRRRLQWTVQRVEEGRKAPAKTKDEAKAAMDDFDPRKLLTVAN